MHIHGRNIIHCDIKPDNIRENITHEAVLLDFDVAIHTDKGKVTHS